MNLDYFKSFINIVEKGSLSEAAKVMGISQPAITMQLKAMEKEYGAILLDRSSGGLKPTQEGLIFLDHAQKITQENELLRSGLADLSKEVFGQLKIGSSTTPGEYILPAILGRFKELHPKVEPKLTIADSEEILTRLAGQEIDIGLIGQESTSSRLEKIAFAEDELVLIFNPKNYMTDFDKIGIEEVMKMPLILREKGSATRKTLENAFERAGFSMQDLTVIMDLGSLSAIISAVEAGLGASIISRSAAKRSVEMGLIREAKILGLDLKRKLYLVFDKKRMLPKAALEFVDFVRIQGERA